MLVHFCALHITVNKEMCLTFFFGNGCSIIHSDGSKLAAAKSTLIELNISRLFKHRTKTNCDICPLSRTMTYAASL